MPEVPYVVWELTFIGHSFLPYQDSSYANVPGYDFVNGGLCLHAQAFTVLVSKPKDWMPIVGSIWGGIFRVKAITLRPELGRCQITIETLEPVNIHEWAEQLT